MKSFRDDNGKPQRMLMVQNVALYRRLLQPNNNDSIEYNLIITTVSALQGKPIYTINQLLITS